MSNKVKKILILAVAAILLVAILAAALLMGGGKTDNGKEGGDTTPGTTDPGAVLPDVNYGDADFRISTKSESIYEVFTDSEDLSDVLDSALAIRNSNVEERFGVKITPVITMENDLDTQVNEIQAAIDTEDDFYDICLTYVYSTGRLVVGGYLIDLTSLNYTDLSRSWWMDDVNKEFAIEDTIYAAVGDMSVSLIRTTFAMFYNRTDGDNMYIDEEQTTSYTDAVIEKVRSGDWTMDYFNALIYPIYDDIDEYEGTTVGDYFGFTADNLTCVDNWNFAFDLPMVNQTANGELECVYNTERTTAALDKILGLYNSYGVRIDRECNWRFANGNALFITSWIDNCLTEFVTMEDTYIILPYPKFDDEQDDYYTGAMDNYSMISVPRTALNLDMISVITEALNMESEAVMNEAYYNQALKGKYLEDPITAEMLDKVMEGRKFDMAVMFGGQIEHLAGLMRNLVQNNSTAFAEKFGDIEEGINQGLERIIEEYRNNK